MDRVNLAIVGCGSVSQLNVPGYLKHERCQIVALCDPIRERAERRAKQWNITPRIYTSYDELLDDTEVDAVELLTPTPLHSDQITSALQAGKHVSCQKPICNTLDEARRLSLSVHNAKTYFRITENFLYYPPLLKAKELLESGAIGTPSFTRFHTIRGSKPTKDTYKEEPGARAWRNDSQVNFGGQVFDGGWHSYATAIWLLGDDIEKISATITKTRNFAIDLPAAITWKFTGRDCLVSFTFGYADRMPVRGKYFPIDDFFEIQGSEGIIWVTQCTGEMLGLPPVVLYRDSELTPFEVPSDWALSFEGAAQHFVNHILTDEQPDMDIEYSTKVLRVAIAAYISSERNTSVNPMELS